MTKRKRKGKKKVLSDKELQNRYLAWSIVIPIIIGLLFSLWYFRVPIYFYVSSWFDHSALTIEQEHNKHDLRNVILMEEHQDKTFGIDVSQYQGDIRWNEVGLINEQFVVDFIFIRATMGEDKQDSKFKKNWKYARKRNKLIGAYHYYRPNENSIKQADNFIRHVKLEAGDLPPVLDIEEYPRNQTMDSLKVGLKRWLDKVEEHYKVRPILYSGDSFYSDFLEKEFSNYTLWIANYNFWVQKPKDHWDFWQFSEKGSVSGVTGFVDLNMYRHTIMELESLCIPY